MLHGSARIQPAMQRGCHCLVRVAIAARSMHHSMIANMIICPSCCVVAIMLFMHAIMQFAHAIVLFVHAIMLFVHAIMLFTHVAMLLRHAIVLFMHATIATLQQAVKGSSLLLTANRLIAPQHHGCSYRYWVLKPGPEFRLST